MPRDNKIVLSHSSLGILETCPRCFWLQAHKKIRWPEAFASRLPSRLDGITKRYFDRYRAVGTLPSFLDGKMKGKLENPFQERYYVNHDSRYSFYGKLDECLITPKGLYSPIDHKTSSSDPRNKDPHPAYQKQLDAYSWLLESNNKKTTGVGYLIFYYPDETKEIDKGFNFIIEIVQLKTNPAAAKERFLNAITVLEKPIPDSSKECGFCNYRKATKEFEKESKKVSRRKMEQLTLE